MKTTKLIHCLVWAIIFCSSQLWADPNPIRILNMFSAGQQIPPHTRVNHAQGVCISGYFEGNGDLASFSSAELFRKGVITPVIGRFSVPGSHAADETGTPVRGMALQFSLTNGEHWQTAMNNAPVFPVATPDNFYRMQIAQQIDPQTGKPNPERLTEFYRRHPETENYRNWKNTKTPSKSYASETYNSLNTFLLENRRGERRAVRWSMRPLQDELKITTARSLQEELNKRLEQGDLRWEFFFTFANWGDATNNATVAWPASRVAISGGTLVIQKSQSQDEGKCRDISFLPTSLPQGVGLSDDPLVYFRSTVYVEALSRRLK